MSMEKLIRELFDNREQNTKYNKIDEEIEQEIRSLLKDEQEHMQPQEYEKYRGKLYEAAFAAKRGGFIEGFRYAARLMAECFIQREDSEES